MYPDTENQTRSCRVGIVDLYTDMEVHVYMIEAEMPSLVHPNRKCQMKSKAEGG